MFSLLKSQVRFCEAAGIILQTEKEFRDLMKQYGLAFMKNEDETIQLLAEQGAELAMLYMSTLGYPDIVAPSQVFEDFLNAAIALVAVDYGEEIAWTLAYLEEKLSDEDMLQYASMYEKRTELEMRATETLPPQGYSLQQNYPNPYMMPWKACFIFKISQPQEQVSIVDIFTHLILNKLNCILKT